MIRMCTVALATLALVACQGNGGAVSVRWRIANLSTGQTIDPMSAAANDESCCAALDPARQCDPTSTWVVRSVSVILSDPASGEPAPGIAPRTFPCEKRESTTAFDLPAGTYAIGLSAQVFDGGGKPAVGVVPPPEVHTIVRGEVVNLQDIEIGVQPLPSSSPAAPLQGPGAMVIF
jgi:hypothetical protein